MYLNFPLSNAHLLVFQVTTDELKNIIGKFNDVGKLAETGITVAGTRYMYLSSRDGGIKVVRAKKDRNGVHCIQTTQSKFLIRQESDLLSQSP